MLFRSWTKVEAGSDHTCGIRDGSVLCWGNNTNGQLGNGSTTDKSSPQVANTGAGLSFTELSLGFGHTCATASDATTWCWGKGGDYQLGNVSASNSTTPVQVGASTGYGALGLGMNHSCANYTDLAGGIGTVCWGKNANEQCGLDSGGADVETPRLLVLD